MSVLGDECKDKIREEIALKREKALEQANDLASSPAPVRQKRRPKGWASRSAGGRRQRRTANYSSTPHFHANQATAYFVI